MCARVYLNGDGIGKGTHISVFFVVMRGQYDALLRWPFRQKITVMLMDQDNVEHVIDSFRPDPTSSSFQRPIRENQHCQWMSHLLFLIGAKQPRLRKGRYHVY
ncbi:TNF receptor-associated factor 2 [Desmophyllum pertusum]|uniref:TNF receptor-associated factor 2 n=1 Tax=Desmophyllum pertusum TaxID=174260 RepID=A0A9X0CGG4_9CNID|nr:TNF receptor-associated factor 2 [Desmophyllum pertusum]